MEFIRLWNKADRRGIQRRLAEHFGISVATVYTIRKRLGLADLHDAKNHPGTRKHFKRVKRLYVKDERSTIQIAGIVRMSEENVRKILVKQGVEMRPQHVTNPAYFRTGSSLTPSQLLNEVKRLYVDEKFSARRIAGKLGIDESAVRTKLRALGIRIEARIVYDKERFVVAPNLNVKGIFLGTSEPYMVIHPAKGVVSRKTNSLAKRKTGVCQWCAKPFPQYIDNGPRTQKFCCSSCKNRAKDYRRHFSGSRINPRSLKRIDAELRNTWGDDYGSAKERLLSVSPVISKNAGGMNR